MNTNNAYTVSLVVYYHYVPELFSHSDTQLKHRKRKLFEFFIISQRRGNTEENIDLILWAETKVICFARMGN